DGHGGDAFAAPGKTQFFGGGGLDTDAADIASEILGKAGAHRFHVRTDSGGFGNHGDIGIAERVIAFGQHGSDGAQKIATVGMPPAFVRGRKVPPDIAQCQRPEHCIAQSMDHHVTIGMRHHTAVMRHAHPAQHDVITVAEVVHVDPLPYAHDAASLSDDRRKSAKARSAGVVTLMLSSEPSTSKGRKPARSMAMASSVTTTPECRASTKACVSASRRNICGVNARQRDSRGSVAMLQPSASACFRVSRSGAPSKPPSPFPAWATRRITSPLRTHGRAASCTSTNADAGTSSGKACKAASTDADLSGPPIVTCTGLPCMA